jgi:hypothetical protein
MIKLIFLTDNTQRRNIAKRYYAVDEQGQFIEDVSDIALDNKLTWKQVLSIVRSSCVALSTSQKCEICGEPREFTSRKDFRRHRTMDTYTCARHQEAPRENSDSPTPSSTSEEAPLEKRVRLLAKSLSDVSERLERLSGELEHC